MGLISDSMLLPYQRRWIEDRASVKVWTASRQIGKSFSLSLEAVMEAYAGRSDNLILSSSERQAQEVMAKVRKHLRYLSARSGLLRPLKETREEITLSTGSRIISLPANPSTVRGFSGNVYLDEFAFHGDSREIWRAMYPTVTRGYKVRVTSTPNGKSNMFYELASGGGGLGPGPGVSRHRTTIHDAVAEGLSLDIKALRAGINDPGAWAQEYECDFSDEARALVPFSLIEACQSQDAHMEPLAAPGPDAELYLGVDIGRAHDLTVFWLLERLGDVLWTRLVKVMRAESFSTQRKALAGLMDEYPIRRACMDSTGLGAQLAEEAGERYGSRVEPVHFTLRSKEDMALRLRNAFEEKSLRIPVSREIREDIHSLRRSVTSTGATRFSAERGRSGHADRFWALALAITAGGMKRQAPLEYASLETRDRSGRDGRGW